MKHIEKVNYTHSDSLVKFSESVNFNEPINSDNLNVITESYDIGITLINNDKILWANNIFAELLSYNNDEFLYHNWNNHFNSFDEYDKYFKNISNQLKTNDSAIVEAQLRNRYGKGVSFKLVIRRIESDRYERLFMIWAEDLNQLKMNENKMKSNSDINTISNPYKAHYSSLQGSVELNKYDNILSLFKDITLSFGGSINLIQDNANISKLLIELPVSKDNQLPKSRIITAFNSAIYTSGLKAIINKHILLEVIGEIFDEKSLFDSLFELKPDALLISETLPDKNVQDVVKEIRKIDGKLKILVFLDRSKTKEFLQKVSMHLIDGILHYDSPEDYIIETLNKVLSNNVYYYHNFRKEYEPFLLEKKPHKNLSDREYQVLLQMSKGKRNKEIAENLKINKNTVATYISRIFRKLKFTHRFEAVNYCIKNGLIK